jgi:hypothetical protein
MKLGTVNTSLPKPPMLDALWAIKPRPSLGGRSGDRPQGGYRLGSEDITGFQIVYDGWMELFIRLSHLKTVQPVRDHYLKMKMTRLPCLVESSCKTSRPAQASIYSGARNKLPILSWWPVGRVALRRRLMDGK